MDNGRTPKKNNARRLRIAQLAAQLLAEGNASSIAHARRKAASRLGTGKHRQLPELHEIQMALSEHQRLFMGHEQHHRIRILREQACAAMGLFADFTPRLTGPVLHGSAGPHDPVILHLFADSCEEISFLLLDHEIPYSLHDRTLPFPDKRKRQFPCHYFSANDIPFELVVFPLNMQHLAPLSTLNNQPMNCMKLAEVQALLDTPNPDW